MNRLPREIQEHYLKTQEWQRLSSNQGELEKLRTQANACDRSRFRPASQCHEQSFLLHNGILSSEELAAEVKEAGFSDVRVLAVEGPAWGTSEFRGTWSDPVEREKLMEFLSLIESEPSIQGAGAHFIAVATTGR